MEGDAWSLSVLACPTPSAMPATETAGNSSHATLSVNGTDITITLDCKVSELADADHGGTWGKHKWLGFGIRTGLAAIPGIVFADDTGAKATLGEADVSEATALGLSAGDFVLYIKADQPSYLTGNKSFFLSGLGMKRTEFTMRIVEPADSDSTAAGA